MWALRGRESRDDVAQSSIVDFDECGSSCRRTRTPASRLEVQSRIDLGRPRVGLPLSPWTCGRVGIMGTGQPGLRFRVHPYGTSVLPGVALFRVIWAYLAVIGNRVESRPWGYAMT